MIFACAYNIHTAPIISQCKSVVEITISLLQCKKSLSRRSIDDFFLFKEKKLTLHMALTC